MVQRLGGRFAGAASGGGAELDQVHRGEDQDAPITIRHVADSWPDTTAKNAANTGSRVITIAARVALIRACAHVWTHSASTPAAVAM